MRRPVQHRSLPQIHPFVLHHRTFWAVTHSFSQQRYKTINLNASWYFAALCNPRGKGQSQLHPSLTPGLCFLLPDFRGLVYTGPRVHHNTRRAVGGHSWEMAASPAPSTASLSTPETRLRTLPSLRGGVLQGATPWRAETAATPPGPTSTPHLSPGAREES